MSFQVTAIGTGVDLTSPTTANVVFPSLVVDNTPQSLQPNAAFGPVLINVYITTYANAQSIENGQIPLNSLVPTGSAEYTQYQSLTIPIVTPSASTFTVVMWASQQNLDTKDVTYSNASIVSPNVTSYSEGDASDPRVSSITYRGTTIEPGKNFYVNAFNVFSFSTDLVVTTYNASATQVIDVLSSLVPGQKVEIRIRTASTTGSNWTQTFIYAVVLDFQVNGNPYNFEAQTLDPIPYVLDSSLWDKLSIVLPSDAQKDFDFNPGNVRVAIVLDGEFLLRKSFPVAYETPANATVIAENDKASATVNEIIKSANIVNSNGSLETTDAGANEFNSAGLPLYSKYAYVFQTDVSDKKQYATINFMDSRYAYFGFVPNSPILGDLVQYSMAGMFGIKQENGQVLLVKNGAEDVNVYLGPYAQTYTLVFDGYYLAVFREGVQQVIVPVSAALRQSSKPYGLYSSFGPTGTSPDIFSAGAYIGSPLSTNAILEIKDIGFTDVTLNIVTFQNLPAQSPSFTLKRVSDGSTIATLSAQTMQTQEQEFSSADFTVTSTLQIATQYQLIATENGVTVYDNAFSTLTPAYQINSLLFNGCGAVGVTDAEFACTSTYFKTINAATATYEDWNNTKNYKKDDVVKYINKLWIAKEDTTSLSSPDTNASFRRYVPFDDAGSPLSELELNLQAGATYTAPGLNNLVPGLNIFQIVVTAISGHTKTYTVNLILLPVLPELQLSYTGPNDSNGNPVLISFPIGWNGSAFEALVSSFATSATLSINPYYFAAIEFTPTTLSLQEGLNNNTAQLTLQITSTEFAFDLLPIKLTRRSAPSIVNITVNDGTASEMNGEWTISTTASSVFITAIELTEGGNYVGSNLDSLSEGSNSRSVVISEDGAISSIPISVTYSPQIVYPAPQLDSVTVNGFSAEWNNVSWTVVIPYWGPNVTVEATAANGTTVDSYNDFDINFVMGPNIRSITASNQYSTASIPVNVILESTIESLTVDGITTTRNRFSFGTVTLASNKSSVSYEATVMKGASVVASTGFTSLVTGNNFCTLSVQEDGGTLFTYTVTVVNPVADQGSGGSAGGGGGPQLPPQLASITVNDFNVVFDSMTAMWMVTIPYWGNVATVSAVGETGTSVDSYAGFDSLLLGSNVCTINATNAVATVGITVGVICQATIDTLTVDGISATRNGLSFGTVTLASNKSSVSYVAGLMRNASVVSSTGFTNLVTGNNVCTLGVQEDGGEVFTYIVTVVNPAPQQNRMPALTFPNWAPTIPARTAISTIGGSAQGMNTTDRNYFGGIVKDWISDKDGALTGADALAQQANIDRLKAAATNGAFAVKFHMDYARVLEDALKATVYDVATTVFFYAGTIDLASPAGELAAAADATYTVPGSSPALQLSAKSIAAHIGAITNGTRAGAYYRFVYSGPGDAPTYAITAGSGYVTVTAGDAVVVGPHASADPAPLDKLDNVDPTIVPDSTLTVVRAADNSYSIRVSDTYKTDISTSISVAVSSEQSRAESAETSLSLQVSTEASRAVAAETSLSTALSTEQSRAVAAEDNLSTAISNEASRADSVETNLSVAISNETSRADSVETNLSVAISNETSRAGSVETVLSTGLSNEVSRAQSAETSLSQAVSSEESRAQAAESTLSSGLSTEVARATGAEGSLSTALSSETSRAESVETSLSTALSGEISRSESVDTSVSTALSSEVVRATSVEDSLSTSLSAEISTTAVISTKLNASLKSAADRLKILEAFVYATEQFVEITDGSGTVLDFTTPLANLGWPTTTTVAVTTDTTTNYFSTA